MLQQNNLGSNDPTLDDPISKKCQNLLEGHSTEERRCLHCDDSACHHPLHHRGWLTTRYTPPCSEIRSSGQEILELPEKNTLFTRRENMFPPLWMLHYDFVLRTCKLSWFSLSPKKSGAHPNRENNPTFLAPLLS